MVETLSDRPPESPPSDPEPAGSLVSRPAFWAALLTVVAAVAVALAALTLGEPAGEKTARRTAVRNYAELYRQSTESVDKFCTVRAKRVDGGAWLVDVTRVVAPGSGGLHITTTFRVERDGRSAYVGRSTGRNGQ